MPKYNEFEISFGGAQYIFVTRGRSKKFDAEEVIDYLKEKHFEVEKLKALRRDSTGLCFPDKPVEPVKDAKFDHSVTVSSPSFQVDESVRTQVYEGGETVWRIPDDRQRRRMFRNDMRQKGMKFCVKKYGQTAEVIQAEISRLASGGF